MTDDLRGESDAGLGIGANTAGSRSRPCDSATRSITSSPSSTRGATSSRTSRLACAHDNRHKGPNLSGLDPVTRELTRLYNPRRDRWREHFAWQGAVLIGLTAVGRTTIQVLSMNDREMVEARESLIAEGRFPPK